MLELNSCPRYAQVTRESHGFRALLAVHERGAFIEVNSRGLSQEHLWCALYWFLGLRD